MRTTVLVVVTGVAASTVELAHRLGPRVVAEVVGTTETFAHLGSLGRASSQGSLHSRPPPPPQPR